MVIENEENQENPIETSVKKMNEDNHHPNVSCAKKKTLLVLFGLITLSALTLSIYSVYQIKSIHTQQNYANQLIRQVKGEQITRIDKLNNDFNQYQEKTTLQLNELTTNFQTALHQHAYSSQDWLLQKAKYYLELAKIEEHWGNNKVSTISLLTQADELIKTINNSSRFFTTRQAIAREIAELNAQKALDITGILSQLDAAQTLITKLPIAQIATLASSMPTTEQATSWRAHLKENLRALQKLIVIRRNDEEGNLLISPLHEALLRDSLRINLQKAQWAVIQNNAAIYQQSLQQSLALIVRAFNLKSSITQTLMHQINELQTVTFNQAASIIGQSLNELDEAIKSSSDNSLQVKGESHD